MRQWRLICDSPAPGAWNMAVDDAVLHAVGAGESLPTLRFYAWSVPCLSLGYGQRVRDVDFDRLQSRGWDIVRRPTGGRAILHTDELTYSLALPNTDAIVADDVVTSYRRISAALIRGLESFGFKLQADQREQQDHLILPICFEVPSHYEITVNGRKLVGSAQVRRHGAVLQHGTIPLTGDITRICDVVTVDDETERQQKKAQIAAVATTLQNALGQSISWHDVAEALVVGFADTFGVQFDKNDSLTTSEYVHAKQLMHDVYGADTWTRRR
ncbi:MAG: lipoate--protein ligase family protein [Chloroflexi bacterium]|nr:MAG: octanoyltransferase [Phototrophicales bacterium]RMF78678.1 MAG: lipoate--protein ligase family protein [Chloroflexota bacterium]